MLYISKFSSQLNFRFLCVFCKSENSCLYFQYEVGVSRESPMKIDRKQIVSVSFRHFEDGRGVVNGRKGHTGKGSAVDYLNEGSFERRKNQKIVHAEALCEMMEALTKDTRFTDMIAKVRSRQEKGGAIIMCEYLDMLEEKGEKRLASLLEKLYALGRDEDAKLAVRDEKARVRLYEELCIC